MCGVYGIFQRGNDASRSTEKADLVAKFEVQLGDR